MSAAAIVADAARAGLTLAARDGRLSVSPASKLSAELRDRLVLHREEVLQLIAPPPPPRSRAWRIQFTDGTACTALHSTPHSADEALAAAKEGFGAARVLRVSRCS